MSEERKTIYLCLAHMSENKMEEKFVQEAFDTNWVVPMGPNVNAFEQDLANFANSKSDGTEPLDLKVVCLSAGTAAVHLALIGCGIQAGDEEKFIDLLFSNRHLNCLVAVELKDCRFKPAHLGQLAFYLSVLDKTVKKPHENPSVGLVLCREMDRTVVELAIRDYTKPMGVATFRLGEDAPEEYNRILPDTTGLDALMQEDFEGQ